MTFLLNLTVTCYCFETLLSRDVNTPRRCDVNKRWRRDGWPFCLI